ncbi:MAG TPA: OsmC family peroxiredoxin [Gaiellaceae bacterium]|nr:OsmC family peroxiredoxin [Gaiellaceae bacterium]
MPRVDRSAHVSWEGNLARGEGRISAPSGVLSDAPYSAATRIASRPETTSPEELLAAAHAGCFAMSLAGELTRAGTPPERLDVSANVTLDEVPGRGHLVVRSAISARARVPGADELSFAQAVEAADEGCTFSALVRASAEVQVDATLEGGD